MYSLHFDNASIVFKLDSVYSGTQLNDTVTGTEGAYEITTEHRLIVDDSVFTTIQAGANNYATASVAPMWPGNRIAFNMADTSSKGLGISAIDLDSLGEVQSATWTRSLKKSTMSTTASARCRTGWSSPHL